MDTATWVDYFDRELNLRDHLIQLHQHLPLIEAILEVKPRSVLEVGIGTGVMSATLAALSRLKVTGADLEESLLDAARANWSNVGSLDFIRCDAFDLEPTFGRDKFDVAFSQGFFEHFTDAQIRELVGQQLTVARRVVFSVPSDQYGRQDFGDERLMSASQWRSILAGMPGVSIHTGYYGLNREYLVRPRGPFAGIGKARYYHVLAVIDRSDTSTGAPTG